MKPDMTEFFRSTDLRSLKKQEVGVTGEMTKSLSGAQRLATVSVLVFRNVREDFKDIRTWADTPEGNRAANTWFEELVRAEHAEADMAALDIAELISDGEWSDSDNRFLIVHSEAP